MKTNTTNTAKYISDITRTYIDTDTLYIPISHHHNHHHHNHTNTQQTDTTLTHTHSHRLTQNTHKFEHTFYTHFKVVRKDLYRKI